MADISALTVKVRLRGLWWMKLAIRVARLPFLRRSWRISFGNFCVHRLSIQVGRCKKTPIGLHLTFRDTR